jgi:hypothetical protein
MYGWEGSGLPRTRLRTILLKPLLTLLLDGLQLLASSATVQTRQH